MAEEKKTTKRKRKTSASKKAINPSAAAKAAISEQEAENKKVKAAEDAAKKELVAAEAAKLADEEAAAVAAAEEEETKPVEKKPKPNKIRMQEVDRIKILLEEFEKVSPKGKPLNALMRHRRLEKLVKVVTFVSSNPSREVLDEVLTFFKKERAGLMSESHILQGVTKLNSSTREKVELLYGALVLTVSNAKAKNKVRPNIELLSKRLGDGVASWFATKNK